MTTRRKQNWPVLLNDFIESRQAIPFQWGANDCCLFVCDAIATMTDIDPAKGIRNRYKTIRGAVGFIRRMGGVAGIAQTICAKYGFTELSTVNLAQRGDVVMLDTSNEGFASQSLTDKNTLGVCLGGHAAFVGLKELEFAQISRCVKAWRVA